MRKHTCHLDLHLTSHYHDWTKEVDSKVDRQPEGEVARQAKGEVVRQAKSSQPTPPIPKPICDRLGQLDITPSVIRAQTNLSVVEQIHDRSGQPDKHTVAQDDSEVCHEAETLNINDKTLRVRIEGDMDFQIPGLRHSIVMHAQSASVEN